MLTAKNHDELLADGSGTLSCSSCPQGWQCKRARYTALLAQRHCSPSNHSAANKFATDDSKITHTSGTADK